MCLITSCLLACSGKLDTHRVVPASWIFDFNSNTEINKVIKVSAGLNPAWKSPQNTSDFTLDTLQHNIAKLPEYPTSVLGELCWDLIFFPL